VFDSAVIVVVNIIMQFLNEMLHKFEFLKIQKFGFEDSKEVLHHGVVPVALTPAR